jgi:hypothetical protein
VPSSAQLIVRLVYQQEEDFFILQKREKGSQEKIIP